MVNIDKASVAKLKKEGKTYEILIDAEKAAALKAGKSVSINDVVVLDEIFYDAKKGTKASETELEKVFGTDDKLEVCKIILMEGNVPVTADMLKKDFDQKRKQIVELIHRNAVDPNTGKPHPITRIDNAMNEAKVRLDANKPAEQQVQDVIHQLRPILPIKFEVRELNIIIPSQFAGKCYTTLKQYGKLLGETWQGDGSLNVTLEIPAGLQEDLEVALNNITKGNVRMEILRSK